MDEKWKKSTVTLHDTFFYTSSLFKDKIAITYYQDEDSEISITYQNLHRESLVASNLLRQHLKLNSSCNTIVALYCDVGIPAIVFILAILQSGAFFYLSPDLPENEFVSLLEKVCVNYVVIQDIYYEKIPKIFKIKILTTFKILNIKYSLIYIVTYENGDLSNKIIHKDDLAYVICTSGSTGFPKIIYVPHRCITQNIEDFKVIFRISGNDIILSLSPFYFDPSVVDIFLGISYGAHLLILSTHILKKPYALKKIMNANPISFMQMTPSLFQTLDSEFLQVLFKKGDLKTLALGGEVFPCQSLWRSWFDLNYKVNIFNLYGLTELSCWASYHQVNMYQYLTANAVKSKHLYSPIPLGRPLTGVKIFLIDKFGKKVTKGEGQIVMHGDRNLCYIDDPAKANQFSYGNIDTGDIGFTDGVDLFYVGRSDNIVKRNACKISLSEIELVSKYLKEVKESCAIPYKNKIVLFISSFSTTLSESMVKNHLKNTLSQWKLPDKIIIRENLPLNSNLKVDKKNLLMLINSIKPHKIDVNKEELLTVFKALWKEFISRDPLDEDNFINSGGNSLQSVQLSEKICSYIPYNPLILQTIINNTFKDLCNLAYENIQLSMAQIQENNKNTKYSSSNIQFKMTNTIHQKTSPLKVYHYGGYYIINKENIKLYFYNLLSVNWTISLNKCVDSSPLVTEHRNQIKIFIGSHSHNFLCVDDKGKIYWNLNMPDRIESSACVSSDENSVYIGCYDGILYCIDINSAKYLWTLKTEGIIKSPCIVDSISDSVVFGSYDKHLYCCSEKGLLKWKTKLTNGFISSSSAVMNNYVFTGTLDGYMVCSCLYSGNLIWKVFIGKPIFSSLRVCTRGVIFGCADNFIYCINFDSVIIWKYKTNGPIFSSPSILENDFLNIIAIGSHDNCFYLLNINGEKILTFEAFSPIYCTPFIVLENPETFYILFVETKGIIYSLKICVIDGVYKPQNVLSKQFNNDIFSSPVFYKGNIYVGCRDNMLYCLKT